MRLLIVLLIALSLSAVGCTTTYVFKDEDKALLDSAIQSAKDAKAYADAAKTSADKADRSARKCDNAADRAEIAADKAERAAEKCVRAFEMKQRK